jgi:predicted RND superfamily exporter protein
MQRLLKRISRLCWLHPAAVLTGVALVTLALAAAAALTLRLDTDLAELMPERSRASLDLQAYLDAFGADDRLLIALGPVSGEIPGNTTELLYALADELVGELAGSGLFHQVDSGPGPDFNAQFVEYFLPHVFQILPPPTTRRLLPALHPREVERSVQRARLRLEGGSPTMLKQLVRVDPLDFASRLDDLRKEQPGGRDGGGPGGVDMESSDGYLLSADRRRLLIIGYPTGRALDTAFARTLLETTRQAVDLCRRRLAGEEDLPALEQLPAEYGGGYLFALEDEANTRKDVKITLLGSLVALLILMLYAYRRFRLVLVIGLPLFAGGAWTLGLTGLFLGRLNMISLGFGAILFGLGMDFSIHLLNRLLDLLEEGRVPADALETGLTETGVSILGSGLTTAAAFFSLVVCGLPGLKELGIITGIGVLATMIAVLFTLPAVLALVCKRHGGTVLPPAWYPGRRPGFGALLLARLVTTHPGKVLVAAAALTVVLFLLPGNPIRFDLDLRNLRPAGSQAAAGQERFEQDFGQGLGEPLVVMLEGQRTDGLLATAEAVTRELWEAEGTLRPNMVESATDWLPSLTRQRENLAVLEGLSLEETSIALTRAGEEQNFAPDAFAPFQRSLDSLIAGEPEWLTPGDLPPALEDVLALRYLRPGPAGEGMALALYLYPGPHRWTDQELLKLRQEVDGAAAGAERTRLASLALLMAEFKTTVGLRFTEALLLSLVLVVLVLLIQLRKPLRVLLTLAPLSAALLWTAGLLRLGGGPVQFIAAMAIPLIVGIGIDDGIHMVNRLRSLAPGEDPAPAVAAMGRSVILTTLTTVAGFGSLAVAAMPGLAGLGRIAVVGVLLCLTATMLLLPAFAALKRRAS